VAYSNLVTHDWITRISPELEVLLGLTIVLLLVGVSLAVTPHRSTPILLVSLTAILSGSYVAFLYGVFVPCVVACSLVAVASTASLLYHDRMERHQRLHLKTLFSHYLDPRMVERLAAGEATAALGGDCVPCILMFTDLQGFTSLSEQLEPAEIADLTNQYFTRIGSIVTAHEGTLVKFIGDGIFGLWGAPLPVDSMADKALDAAFAIAAVRDITDRHGVPLVTRIGLHMSPVIVGNLGSQSRFDYTAIGDGVNVASRLEGLNKAFGTTLILSEAVRSSLAQPERHPLLSLGKVAVVGRVEPLQIYTSQPSVSTDTLAVWNRGVAAFELQLHEEAAACFRSLASAREFAQASGCFLAQIEKDDGMPADARGTSLVFQQK
jgi:adenylate cyclase